MNRRDFVRGSAGALLAAAVLEGAPADDKSALPEYQKTVFDLHKQVPNPVKIASVDLLQSGKQYFVRVRSTDGAEGLILTKDMEDFVPILKHRVIPRFLNKDARD